MINTKFWDDTYIMKLDPIEKLLFIYFISNPLTNLCGIYEISLRRIAFDTGIDSEMVSKILKRFEKEKKIIYAKGWIFIVNFIKNQNLGENIEIGIKRVLNEIPQEIHKALGTGWGGGGDGVGELNLTKLNLTKQKERVRQADNISKTSWNYNHKIEEMSESKNDMDRLLAYFWQKKGFVFENSKQLSERYRRDCKTGKRILESGYNENQVEKTFDYVAKKYKDVDWVLETILKAFAEATKNEN